MFRKLNMAVFCLILIITSDLAASMIEVFDGQALEIAFKIPKPPNEFQKRSLAQADYFNIAIPLTPPIEGKDELTRSTR